MNINLSTPRLHYNIITHDRFDDLYETLNNKDTCANISLFNWPLDNEKLKEFCTRSEKNYASDLEYLYIAYDNYKPAGHVGIYIKPDECAEIGYWVAPEFQGKGLASEMVKGACDMAFTQLNVPQIYATAALNNHASHKVLRNNLFQKTGNKNVECADGHLRPSHVFTKTQNKKP